MLTIDEIDLPQPVLAELREKAAFSDSLSRFTRQHLAGFQQPVAAAAAFIGPILISFTYILSGFFSMVEVAVTFGATTAAFILCAWFVNRREIRAAYEYSTEARRAAKVDLKIGRGDRALLQQRRSPVFYEHAHGVIVLAEADDGKTLYFDVDSGGDDVRWFFYVNGDMHRAVWRWLRLQGSGDVTAFDADGQRLDGFGEPPYVDAADAWEAISLALGEPQDGDIIDLPFEEARQTVSRLL